jgi:hypothetical protein
VSHKTLPLGTFVLLRPLPENATDESIAEYFAQYIPITADNVSSVRMPEGQVSAIISVDQEIAAFLLNWAFGGTEFPGNTKPINFKPFHRQKDRPNTPVRREGV